MKLSQESQYGILGTVFLARQPFGTIMQVSQVAEATGLARPFLAKIFGRLAHGGVLRSYRGRERGYALARPGRELSVKMIVEAVEGPDIFERCVFWSDVCSDSRPCVLHDVWRTVRPAFVDLVARTTIEDLALNPEISVSFERCMRTRVEASNSGVSVVGLESTEV